jgi:hypothetical protein
MQEVIPTPSVKLNRKTNWRIHNICELNIQDPEQAKHNFSCIQNKRASNFPLTISWQSTTYSLYPQKKTNMGSVPVKVVHL